MLSKVSFLLNLTRDPLSLQHALEKVEGEEGEGGEEEEGGVMDDDLERVLASQVEGGEDGQQTLWGEQEANSQWEVRRAAVV